MANDTLIGLNSDLLSAQLSSVEHAQIENQIEALIKEGTMVPFITPRGRIMARKQSGICARHQKSLAKVIKQARHLAMLSYSGVVAERE